MPDLPIELIPLVGIMVSTIVRWWKTRRAAVIVVTGEQRDRLGDADSISLSPELVHRLEGEPGGSVFAEVRLTPSSEPELTTAPPDRRGLPRGDITFLLVVLFSVVGFVWSIVVLSLHSSSSVDTDAATATLGWMVGYWFRPELLQRRSS